MPTLFFLHIPKCAGMTLTEALIERLPDGTVYQSTSMIRNFRENRPEFLEITQPKKLRAVVGHWLHESMLSALQRPIYLATSLRHPVDRIRSQFRFDVGLRGGSWPKPETRTFLQRNSNVTVNFLTRAFPTIARDYEDRVSAAKAILSGLDSVFDVSNADIGIRRLLKVAGASTDMIRRSNASDGITEDIEVTDALIAEHCHEDLEVYEWFMSTQSETSRPSNPVFNRGVRAQFASLISRPFNPSRVEAFLAPKYALELRYGGPDINQVIDSMRHKSSFAQSVITSLQSHD
jgi:hypothetical protein